MRKIPFEEKCKPCAWCGKLFAPRTKHTKSCSFPCAMELRKSQHVQRFWKFAKKEGPIPPHMPHLGNCWEWTGALNSCGYGSFNTHIGSTAHRYSYVLHIGSAEGKNVCHSCDNPKCVNPAHLFLGTQKDNMRDAGRKGRMGKSKGARNPWAKLNDDAVRFIRANKQMGSTELANKFNVSDYAIYSVRTGRSWKHIV